ncbi:hypothetical protein D3C74_326520 [compost metagenome]
MPGILCVMIRLFNKVSHFTPKRCFKELLVKNNFVNLLQLCQGKQLGHQVESNIGVLHLSPQTFDGAADYFGMIEG